MASDPNTDIDFWELVSCARCHLPYASEPGKSVPFWLTECGHVICNNHLSLCLPCLSLNPLATALQIRTKVVPHVVRLEFSLWLYNKRFTNTASTPALLNQCCSLQLDTPMSDWFRSVPSALDSIAYAVKVRTQQTHYIVSEVFQVSTRSNG